MQATFTEKVRFVENVFGKGVVSRSGNDIAVACPVCKDSKKKKLAISLSTWSFHCWICDSKGRTLLPILRKNFSRDVVDSYRQKFLGQTGTLSETEEEVEKKFEYPQGFVPIVNILESKNPNVKSAIAYLKSRGLTERDFYRYRVGITPDGKDPRRVFFVSLDIDGEENYFVSRSIDDKAKQRYVNADIDKTKIIFNECEIDWDDPVFLVEGIFDQIRLNKNSACLLGSTLPESSLLFRRIVENECDVVLALDADAQQKSNKIADSLIKFGCGVRIMPLNGGKDLGSMSQDQIDSCLSDLKDWNGRTSLLSRISMIKSGSIL